MNKILTVACMCIMCLQGGLALAQQAGSPAGTLDIKTPANSETSKADNAKATPPGLPIVFGRQTLFTVRDIEGYSAQERAQTINSRIDLLVKNPNIDVNSISTLAYQKPMTVISAGQELIIVVFDEDAKSEGLTREALAAQWSQKIKATITTYRHEHTLEWIMTGALKSLIATVIFGLLLFVLHKSFKKADTALQGLINRRKISIHIQSLELIGAGRIVAFISGVLRMIRILLIILLLYAYVHSVMLFFPWTKPYASQILNFILKPLGTIGGAVLKAIPDLFLVAIIAALAYYLLKLLQTLFIELEKGSIDLKGFYPEWAQPTFKICRLLIIFIAAIMAFPYIPGSNSPAFKGISIFIGVLFSLGSTSAISNIMAGYSLIYRRVFKVGDRVKIADFMGDVIEMRLQVTHLMTIKNEEIVVPNSMIASSHVINYSSLASEKGLILHTGVTIGYDTPWRQVHALLLMAAEKTPGLLSDPVPFVLQTSLNDFYVSYELNAYTETPHTMIQVYSDLHRNIQDAFNEYGVQIMSPSYLSDPERPKVVPKDQWYASPAKPPEK